MLCQHDASALQTGQASRARMLFGTGAPASTPFQVVSTGFLLCHQHAGRNLVWRYRPSVWRDSKCGEDHVIYYPDQQEHAQAGSHLHASFDRREIRTSRCLSRSQSGRAGPKSRSSGIRQDGGALPPLPLEASGRAVDSVGQPDPAPASSHGARPKRRT